MSEAGESPRVEQMSRRGFFEKFRPKNTEQTPAPKKSSDVAIDESSPKSDGLTRREFLKEGGTAAGMVIAPDSIKNAANALADFSEGTLGKEKGENPVEYAMLLNTSPDPIADAPTVLKNLYDPNTKPLEVKDQITDILAQKDLDPKKGATLLFYRAFYERQTKETSSQGFRTELENSGHRSAQRVVDATDCLSVASLSRDDLGNWKMDVKTDPNKLIGKVDSLIQQNPKTKVIDLGAAMGTESCSFKVREVIPLASTGEVTNEDTNTTRYTIANDIAGTVQKDGISWPAREVNGELVALREDELLTEEQFKEEQQKYKLEVRKAYKEGRKEDYEGKIEDTSRLDITESYGSSDAENSLRQLISIAKRYPNQIVIAPAGDYSQTDYDNVRRKLKDDWADNLLLVGGERPAAKGKDSVVGGADLYLSAQDYVEGKYLNDRQAAAIATSVVSMYLANEPLPSGSKKEYIAKMKEKIASNKEYKRKDKKEENPRIISKLDPAKYKEKTRNKSKISQPPQSSQII